MRSNPRKGSQNEDRASNECFHKRTLRFAVSDQLFDRFVAVYLADPIERDSTFTENSSWRGMSIEGPCAAGGSVTHVTASFDAELR